MSASHVVTDSLTITRRNLKKILRVPDVLVSTSKSTSTPLLVV